MVGGGGGVDAASSSNAKDVGNTLCKYALPLSLASFERLLGTAALVGFELEDI